MVGKVPVIPIDRASVIVRFVGVHNYVALGKKMRTTWELKTNQEGIAKLPSMPMGEIQVQVHAKGYQIFGQKYEINEAEKWPWLAAPVRKGVRKRRLEPQKRSNQRQKWSF